MLAKYVMAHCERGACMCGRCFDGPESPEDHQPGGHTADMIFFKVKLAGNPNGDELKRLIREHKGHHNEIDLFDGKEHTYLEIGGWIGDQGLALQFMGMGNLLGLFNLLTPVTVMGLSRDEEATQKLVGMGFVAIRDHSTDSEVEELKRAMKEERADGI